MKVVGGLAVNVVCVTDTSEDQYAVEFYAAPDGAEFLCSVVKPFDAEEAYFIGRQDGKGLRIEFVQEALPLARIEMESRGW